MSAHDLDLDVKMSELESDWRQAYESSIAARADYQALAANSKTSAKMLDVAHEQLERAEALKARIMVRIERLESEILGRL